MYHIGRNLDVSFPKATKTEMQWERDIVRQAHKYMTRYQARAVRIAYDWSAGSGDGLMCYSFASLGGVIHETTLDDDGQPKILVEIEGNLRCVRGQCKHERSWHPDLETKKNESELLYLKAYIEKLFEMMQKEHA